MNSSSTRTRWIAVNRNAGASTANSWYVNTRGWTSTQVDLYTSVETNYTIALGGF